MGDQGSSLTDREREQLISLRRDFHRHPELAFQETRSAGVIAEALRGMGLEPVTGIAETGVSAVIAGHRPRATLMLRADMDALPVTELPGRPYGSENEGVMHACGHDAHMATLLTVCAVLQRQRGDLPGRVKAVFQPAEEGMGGARRMIADGVLENPRVEAAFGLHYWSQLPTGKVAVSAGPLMAAVDEFTLRVKGRGGHAAMPHEAADPIVAGAALVSSLQALVSRRCDPGQALVVSVTTFNAGSAFNIIPDEAVLTGTVRCFDKALWRELPLLMEEVARGACAAHGCHAELDYRRINIPLVNDAAMAALVREEAEALLGPENVEDFSTLGGEDMAYFLEEVPGCFFIIGAGNEAKGIGAPHHNPAFDLDEDALPLGVELMLRVTRRYLGR